MKALTKPGFTVPVKSYDNSIVDYAAVGCSEVGIFGKAPWDVMSIAEQGRPSIFTGDSGTWLGRGLLITGLLAIFLYVALWCIGWVFAGFTRDA